VRRPAQISGISDIKMVSDYHDIPMGMDQSRSRGAKRLFVMILKMIP
jgi:hypothetical protein